MNVSREEGRPFAVLFTAAVGVTANRTSHATHLEMYLAKHAEATT